MACEILNATLSNTRVGVHRMRSKEFNTLMQKFLKMRSQIKESKAND